MKGLLPILVALTVLGGVLALIWVVRGREASLLVAAPGMTIKEIVERSTARFEAPREDDERGRAQPEGPTRVLIYHPEHGFEVPAGRFTIVDTSKGIAWMVTATPQLDYLGAEETIALLRRIHDAISAANWEWEEVPNYDVLAQELPKHTGRVLLGRWRLGSWEANLTVSQALEVSSEEARIAGMPGGGFLTTLTVYDEALDRTLRGW